MPNSQDCATGRMKQFMLEHYARRLGSDQQLCFRTASPTSGGWKSGSLARFRAELKQGPKKAAPWPLCLHEWLNIVGETMNLLSMVTLIIFNIIIAQSILLGIGSLKQQNYRYKFDENQG